MKRLIGILLLAVLGIFSCSAPKMDAELVKSMIIGYENGVVAGISVGDNWEDVKNNIHKGWESGGVEHKFIKSWDDFNNVILFVVINNENKVESFSLTINGKPGNHLLIKQVQNTLQKEFNVKFEAKSDETWNYKAPNGDDCGIIMSFIEQDTGSNSLGVTVYNSSK